ncbi:MAG: PEP-CTERM sorting domain-containing protein [Planctomycetota bacterium]|nr:MAG: PEP-CTERM sorting domain-containing protein [Planctomycetota bacterium]
MRRRSILTAGAMALAMTMSVQVAHAAVIDLTTDGSSGSVNGALFYQFDSIPTGSGVIDSFLRIQGMGVQHGYNTDGTIEYDTMASFTHSIQISDLPTIDIGGTLYREFMLDINQNGEPILSLDELRIALWDTGNLSGYSSIFASPIYDLDAGGDNWIKMDYSLNAGSGHGDIIALIPDAVFTGLESQYVYLYSKFGVNSVADDGFEEWAYGLQSPLIPEPTTITLLGFGALFLPRRKRR